MSTAMALLVLAAFLLPLATAASAVTTARRNCSTCGYDDIPYPFGVGPSCSLPGFSLTCAVDTDDSSRLLLGNSSVEVDLFFRAPLSASDRFLPAIISYYVKMIPGVRNYSVHWETPARPFVISGSSNMSLFVVGCGVKVSLFIGNSAVEVGNCSVVCAEAQVMEKLPAGPCGGTVVGLGCCLIGIQVNVRAFTVNISRITGSPSSKRVQTFISGLVDQFWPIDAYSELDENYYGTPAQLDWSIPYQPSCERAMEHKDSYACASKHSKCQDSPMGGYICYCESGNGNAYVDDGCIQDPPVLQYDSIQPRTDCPTSCGNVTIPFPFGVEIGCFAKPDLYLACIPGTTAGLPVPELTNRMVVTDISIDDGILHVRDVSEQDDFTFGDSDSTLYALSGKWGMVQWVIDNMACEHAKLNKSDYRCFSSHSDCLDVTDDGTLKHLGYRCKCSSGFEGNPYIKDGCTDTNECLQPDKFICNGICHNKYGSYTCISNVLLGVVIGLSSGGGILFLSAIVAILHRRWNRVIQKRLRKRYFRKNKGILLEQLISSDNTASDGTKIFSLEELQKATDNFDHSRVVGRGGHGTVYKGILTDQRVVAIKNEHGEKQNLSNYFLWAMRERPVEEIVDTQILEEETEEGILCIARLAEECLSLTRVERPTMKDVEMRLQLLTGRRVAPRARRDEVAWPRCETQEDNGHGCVVSMVGQHGSRQYSQEQEFMSSVRVPR